MIFLFNFFLYLWTICAS